MLGRLHEECGLQWAGDCKVQRYCSHPWAGLNDNVAGSTARCTMEQAGSFAFRFYASGPTLEETSVSE
jgi:hypothetical protein